jgi:hypothetical protein
MLKQHYTDIDADLSPLEQATSLAIIRMAEEHFYFICVYFRWIKESSWKQFAPLLASPFVRNVIGPFIKATIRKSLWGHGIGRHTESDMLQFAREDLESLSTLLGQSEFFFGKSKPHLVDIVVFSMIAMVLDIAAVVKTPLVDLVNEFKTLVAFRDRMAVLVN